MSAQPPIKKEKPIPVFKWGGLMSGLPLNDIPINSFSTLLNKDFIDAYTIRTRLGTAQWMPNTTVGANDIVEAMEIKLPGWAVSRIVFVCNSKLWYIPSDGSTSVATEVGALSASTTKASIAVLGDYVMVSDGTAAWRWDGTTLAAQALPQTGNVIDCVLWDSRIWFYLESDWVVSSELNDPLTYTGGTTFQVRISRGDNATPSSMTPWTSKLIVNKFNEDTYSASMWVIEIDGSSYSKRQLFGDQKNPTCFVGKSGVQIANDVIGLTPVGFSLASAIDNYQQAEANALSDPAINDIIARINWDQADKIRAVHDLETKQYFCAVPLDNASYNSHIITFDYNFQRWGLYQFHNSALIRPRCFFRIKKKTYLGDQSGRLIKMRSGTSDLGYNFDVIVETGDKHFDSPDTVKLFKSTEMELVQEGDYTVTYTPIYDSQDGTATDITLTLDAGNSLWDDFVWDDDLWDVEVPSIKTILLLARGKYLRERIRSDSSKPFTLRGLTNRVYVTDAGPDKP